jgi:hypothetical protein
MPAADFTWSGVLAAVTTYLYAPRYKIADGTIHFSGFSGSNVNADPNTVPLTSTGTDDQKNQLSVNQNFDGYIPLSSGFINVTTPNNGGTGGGSSGGDPGCVHEDELVEAITNRGHEIIRIGDVVPKRDLVRGVDLATGEVRYRMATGKTREACYDWYEVAGRLCTPCERIWCEDKMAWVPAHEIGVHKIGHFGYKISLPIEAREFDNHNFALVGKNGEPDMIVHNPILPRS